MKEKLEADFQEIDRIMGTPEFLQNDDQAWDQLGRVLKRGIERVGRARYRELFEEKFGKGSARHFMKENDSDPE